MAPLAVPAKRISLRIVPAFRVGQSPCFSVHHLTRGQYARLTGQPFEAMGVAALSRAVGGSSWRSRRHGLTACTNPFRLGGDSGDYISDGFTARTGLAINTRPITTAATSRALKTKRLLRSSHGDDGDRSIPRQDSVVRHIADVIQFMTLLTAQTAFYYMATASVVSAILAVTRRNPVHSMLWVLALFLHVAGIFLLLGAEFLAAVQVIVYAGAILVFYLFVLMLLDLPSEQAQPRVGKHWPLACAAGFSFAALAWFAVVETHNQIDVSMVSTTEYVAADTAPSGSLSEIGTALFGPFALPFEIASLILLAAIVGAVILARRRAAES